MPFEGDPLAFHGKLIIEEYHASLLQRLPDLEPHTDHRNNFPSKVSECRCDRSFYREHTVGILGAGIGGLYTALILDSLNLKYEVFEASGRAGGRISTYRFPNKGTYDYFDEGAMRYPLPKKNPDGTYKNGTMKRLAELIEYPPLNQGSSPLQKKLRPYYFKARQSPGSKPGFYYFNGVHKLVPYDPDANKGPFRAQDMGISDDYIQAGSAAIHGDTINPFVRILTNDLQTGKRHGWNSLKVNDSYSVRGYMASKYLPSYSLKLPPTHLPNDVINWCNLLEDSSGGYDRALTEEVFDSLAFAKVGDNDYGDVEWKCFEGGSEALTKKIEKYLRSRTGSFITYNKRVTAIDETEIRVRTQCKVHVQKGDPDRNQSYNPPLYDPKNNFPHGVRIPGPDRIPKSDQSLHLQSRGLEYKEIPISAAIVTVTAPDGSTESKLYSHVISTLPLPVLRTIDLNNAGLNVFQRNALRALDYGPAIKVAILFKSNWWTTKLGITGGQSFTDLPIRTIVYPSYGVDSATPSKVLIASYTWTTDASRLGSLALKENKKLLKKLVLRNLAEAHGYYNKEITYEFLDEEYEDMHVKDWDIDEYTMGGYAKFSPGEFEALYASLNFPAATNSLHFAGEAVSTRHSWAVGALDSAWRAVYEYLTVTGQYDKIEIFKQIWGTNKEWTTESTLAKDGNKCNLLEEHIGLVNKAILAGVA